MAAEFEIDEPGPDGAPIKRRFKSRSLPLMTAADIFVMLAPLLAQVEASGLNAGAIAMGLAEINRDNRHFIINTIMTATQVQIPHGDGQGYADVWNLNNQAPMFDWIGLKETFKIIGLVLTKDVLKGFLDAPPSNTQELSQAAE